MGISGEIALAVAKAYTRKMVGGYVTPQTFGAVGDGVTDDTQAIKNMFASGKNVYLPEGTYYVTEQIRVTNSIIIDGAGAKKAVIKADQNFDYSTNNTPYFFYIREAADTVWVRNIGIIMERDTSLPYVADEIALFGANGGAKVYIDGCWFKASCNVSGLSKGINLVWGAGTKVLDVRNSLFQNHCNAVTGGCIWWYNWSASGLVQESIVADKIIFENNYIEHSTRDEAIGVWTYNDNTKPLWKDVQIRKNYIVHDSFVPGVDAYTSDNFISVNANEAQAAWNYGQVIIEGNTLIGNYDVRCFIKAWCNMAGILIKDNHCEDNSVVRNSYNTVNGCRMLDTMSCHNMNVVNNSFISTAPLTVDGNQHGCVVKSSGSANYIGNTINSKYATFTFNTQVTLATGYIDTFKREILTVRENKIKASSIFVFPTTRSNSIYFTDNDCDGNLAIAGYKKVNWFLERNTFNSGSGSNINIEINGGSFHFIDNVNYTVKVYEDKITTKWDVLELRGPSQQFKISTSYSGGTEYPALTPELLAEFANKVVSYGLDM